LLSSSLPDARELGEQGRHDEALDFMRELVDAHYLRRLGEMVGTRSQRDRERAEAMSPSEAIALELRPPSRG
jgi:hypothetical protein